MHKNYQLCRDDGLGDGGELFRIAPRRSSNEGGTPPRSAEDVETKPWRYAVPVDWDDDRVQREIEACGAKPVQKPPAQSEADSVG